MVRAIKKGKIADSRLLINQLRQNPTFWQDETGTILKPTDPNAYSPFIQDKVDHICLLGDNTFGFEDLNGGGDMDYNDVIVKVNLQSIG
jgi:hypothetical protein